MITDKQGREWLLQKLYDDGWKYYVKNIGTTAFVTTKRPVINDGILDINSGDHVKCINSMIPIMPKIEQGEVLSIAEELGIVDWTKVEVDTPILIRDFETAAWEKRHFAFFKKGKIYAWVDGATSWTIKDTSMVFSWKYAKLAEV